jgi:phenylalanyl-tRNA synthetase alpha subunit
MAALEAVEKVKVAGFVNTGYNRGNQNRIAKEEQELQDLIENKNTVPEEKESKQEEVPLTKEEESFKKRYGDLRRHMQEKEKEWESKLQELEVRMQGTTSLTPPKSREEVESWIKKHPDVAAIVQALAEDVATKRFSAAEQRLQELDADRFEVTRQKAEQEILKSHSDFNEIKVSDDFHEWAEEQPKWVQDAVYENADDPRSVVRVLDLYKVDRGMTKTARKQSEKDAATFVRTKNKTLLEDDASGSYFSESQVSAMSDKEYEKNQDKILEAMRTGKFKYDLSGGAR